MRQVGDARGRPVTLPERVDRVVSLVPSLTEWLVHAGVGERLVGVTDWCAEPAEVVARLPKVRGTKNPDLRAIRALQPDLVVANAEENRKLDVDRLEAGGLPDLVLLPSEPYSFGAADTEEVAGWSGARVELVDGRALTWYGRRIPAALAAFRALLAASA